MQAGMAEGEILYLIVDYGVEYGHHPVQRECLGPRELAADVVLLGLEARGRLPLLAVVLQEEAFVRLHLQHTKGTSVKGHRQNVALCG